MDFHLVCTSDVGYIRREFLPEELEDRDRGPVTESAVLEPLKLGRKQDHKISVPIGP